MYVWIEINNATLFLPYVLIENIHYRLKQELVYANECRLRSEVISIPVSILNSKWIFQN